MARWYIAAGAVLAIVAFFTQRDEANVEPTLPPELADEPDFYIEGAHISQYRDDGTLDYRMLSQSITHFEKDRLTRIAEPAISLHPRVGPPWEVASIFGYIRERLAPSGAEVEEQIFLKEQVQLRRSFSESHFVSVQTESLYVYPRRQYAQTSQPVIIDTESSRTRAVGFEADLELGSMKLSSTAEQRVHIIVLPQALD